MHPLLPVALRRYREAQNCSARQLSLAAGLSESVVGKIEAGTMEPGLHVFAAIVTALRLTTTEIAFLVRLEAQPPPPSFPTPDDNP